MAHDNTLYKDGFIRSSLPSFCPIPKKNEKNAATDY